MAAGDRVKMPGMGPMMGGGPMGPPPEKGPAEEPDPGIDPDFEEAAIAAFPELEGDSERLSALQRMIQLGAKTKGPGLGILIGVGKAKGK